MKHAYLPLLLLCVCNSLVSFDLSHFFQAQFFPEEPRFAKDGLTSARLRASVGSTRIRNDCCGAPISCNRDNRYRIHTLVLDGYHNFTRNFYAGFTLPFYDFNIYENNQRFCFATVGNLCLMAGWTSHHEDCEELDFYDVAIETGVVAPTAEEPLTTTGIPIRGVISCGIYDWLTTGIAADVVTFFDRNNGRLWDVSWFVKADHVLRGLSFGFGYTHSNQTTTPVPWVCPTTLLPCWTMDTFSFIFGYDGACDEFPAFPQIDFFYNHVLSGKNVLKTPNWGLSFTSYF